MPGRERGDSHGPPPRLVVLDVMLPHVDGLEVCRLLRQRSDIPIILVTARSTEDDKLAGLDLGERLTIGTIGEAAKAIDADLGKVYSES